jgi:hypothetical protein
LGAFISLFILSGTIVAQEGQKNLLQDGYYCDFGEQVDREGVQACYYSSNPNHYNLEI